MAYTCYKCGKPLEKHPGQYGDYLRCSGYPACDVMQRVYNGMPIGIQTDKHLRSLRKKGHVRLKEVRRYYDMGKKESYAWLAGRLRIPVDLCHFGMFNKDMCTEALNVMEQELWRGDEPS